MKKSGPSYSLSDNVFNEHVGQLDVSKEENCMLYKIEINKI